MNTAASYPKYIAKIDDDNIYISNIVIFLLRASTQTSERFIAGIYRSGGRPRLSGKWLDPVYKPLYQNTQYPVFFGGPGYYLTNNFVSELLRNCVNRFFIVFVNGICSVGINMHGMYDDTVRCIQ